MMISNIVKQPFGNVYAGSFTENGLKSIDVADYSTATFDVNVSGSSGTDTINGQKTVIKDLYGISTYNQYTFDTSTGKMHDLFTLNNGRDNNDLSFQGTSGKLKVTAKYKMMAFMLLCSSIANGNMGGQMYINNELVKTFPQRTVGQWSAWVQFLVALEAGDIIEVRNINTSSYAWYGAVIWAVYRTS